MPPPCTETLHADFCAIIRPGWTPEKQDSFSNYMGQTIQAWSKINADTLHWMFDGTEESNDLLWKLFDDGKLIGGAQGDGKSSDDDVNVVAGNIQKSFYGFTIPTLWQLSETYAFVLDSGYDCNKEYPVEDYLDKDTMDATGACYDGRRYYLVYPKGDAEECSCSYIHTHCERTCRDNKFSAPPGLDSLNGTLFGNITKEDLIKG